jgi:hypothetical protein
VRARAAESQQAVWQHRSGLIFSERARLGGRSSGSLSTTRALRHRSSARWAWPVCWLARLRGRRRRASGRLKVPVPRFRRWSVRGPRHRRRCVRITGRDLVARLSVPLQCDAGSVTNPRTAAERHRAGRDPRVSDALSLASSAADRQVEAVPSGKLQCRTSQREFVRRERDLAARLSLPLSNTIQDRQQPQELRQTPTRQKRTPQLAMHPAVSDAKTCAAAIYCHAASHPHVS